MLPLLRGLIFFCIFLVGVAIAAAWLLVPRLDPTPYRADIIAIASARLGRDVSIDGPIHLALLPEPQLTADKVRLGSDQGLSITAAELRLTVALWPLAAGRIDARELVLRGADMRLPWPLDPSALIAVRTPRWLSSVTARVEDGTLVVAGLSFTGIDATLTAVADTGSYATAGSARFSGQPWRFTARLSEAGQDGSAGLDVTLDGQGPAQGVGGTLSGQIAPDGSLVGHVSARGPNLSRLLPAPPVAFEAAGRVTIAGGLAAADDLAMKIGGSPARGVVALRVTPAPRLDLALAASRLDLDLWLPVLLRAPALDLPTGVDLSAEAANFAGGTLRGLRAAVDLTNTGAEVREVRAVLPGDAPLRLSGRIGPAESAGHPPRFEGEVAVSAAALRTTLDWVRQAGVSPIAALPEGVLRTADLAGHVVIEPGQLAVSQLAGALDGSPITGSVSFRAGPRWSVGAGVSIDRLDLESWLPAQTPSLAALPTRLAAFDLNLRLEAKQAMLRGLTVAPLSLDAGAEAGRLTLRKLDLQIDGVHVTGAGTVGAGGRVTEARLDLQAPQAAPLAGLLPAGLAFLGPREQAAGLWKLPATLQVLADGMPDRMSLKITADLADLKLESQPLLDLNSGTWNATATLRHPGAPRLMEALGISGGSIWLGDGSLGLIAQLSGGSGRIVADSFDLAAGGLRATGALLLDRNGPVPMLTGRVAAETLPLPLPLLHSSEPFAVSALAGWDASVKLQAGQVLVDLLPTLAHVEATVSLQDGELRLDAGKAELAGGQATGVVTLDTKPDPPGLAVTFGVSNAVIGRPVFDMPLDLALGTLAAHVAVTASGHAPAAMLATLAGEATFSVHDGTLTGLSMARMLPDLDSAGLTAALAGGATRFDTLSFAATIERGVLTLHNTALASPAGAVTADGDIDLPGNTTDLHLQFRPAVADPPQLGLRLTGPWSAPRRLAEIAPVAAWRAAHPPAPPTPAPPSPTPPAPAATDPPSARTP
jgi:hypothetical protein